MQKPPRVVYKKSYLNLDAIFGHVYSNVTGEPITPTKIATFYLVRILFQTHFGYRHHRSQYPPFDQAEKQAVFHWLYALMTSKEEVSYTGFRRITRFAFRESREINRNFYACMEKIGSGESDVDLSIEDEFYTNKHSKDPSLPRDDPIHDALEHASRDDLHFSSSHSFMYRWLKRLLAQYTKTSPTELFEINETMRKWIQAEEERTFDARHMGLLLPKFIDCSMNAREWIAENIHHLQKNPHLVIDFDDILYLTKIVQQRQPDVVEAFLLEAAVQVQLRNSHAAIRAIKSYFELSMFELNNNMGHAVRTHRLAVPTQAPMMYAPILQARVLRLFGDYKTARLLLQESLQQAQIRNDELCHQLGNIELHTVDIIGSEAILENKAKKPAKPLNEDRRVLRKALRHIDDLHGHSRSGPCCEVLEEDFEIVAEMDSLGKMIMLFKVIAEGNYKMQYKRVAETGISCVLGNDHEERGQKVTAYGYALMTSNMIRNGLYELANSTAKEMLVNNVRSDDDEGFHTETFAVGASNLAYSFAGMGDFDAALATIDQMRKNYPEDLSWQSNRHVIICAAIIHFERFFLRNDYKACKQVICDLSAHSNLEYQLRRAILLAAVGRDQEAIKVLKELKLTDVRGRIRIHMQLASIYTANKLYEKTESELDEALDLAEGTTLMDMKSLIKRRRATMMACRGNYVEAITLLDGCAPDIEKLGSFTEKACFYITVARSLRMLKQDPRIWLKRARSMVGCGQWPSMEKLVLTEIAALHDPKGLMPNSNRLSQISEQFGKLTTEFPGRCEWLLI